MPHNKFYSSTSDLPEVLPLFPLAGALLLPRVEMPLNIFELRYMALVDDVMTSHRLIGLVQPKFEGSSDEKKPQLSHIGCVGRVTALQETGDNRYFITLTGIARYEVVEELVTATPYRQARVSYQKFGADLLPGHDEETVDRPKLLDMFKKYLAANEMEADWRSVTDAPNEALVNALSMMSPYGVREKQALLEAPTLADRAEILIAITELNLAQKNSGFSEVLN